MSEVYAVHKKRKKWPLFLGTVILVLALVGAVSIGLWVRSYLKENNTETVDYSEYAKYLTWVVGVDPEPFTDITKADYASLLNIAACSLLTDEVKTGDYAVTESGMVVPAEDVAAYFVKMFGTEVPVVHSSIIGYGYEFLYVAQTNSYVVPLTGVTPPFVPRIESVQKTGGLAVLRVGYVGTNNIEVGADGTIAATQPDKYMDITLKETADGFNLISIVTQTMGEYQ